MLRKIALVLALFVTLAGPAALHAQEFDKVIVAGDSLSDDGNLFVFTGGQLLPSPYSEGRASNGEVWVEYLAADLDTPMINLAFVGAQTGFGLQEAPPSIVVPLQLNQGDLRIPSIGWQISQYLLFDQPTEDSLIVIWGGANDIFFGEANTRVSVNNISQHIRKFAQNGGKTFLIPNMPPLEKTPFGVFLADDTTHAALEFLSHDFNIRLAAELNALEAELGVTIIQFDVHTLLNTVIENPVPYGFLDAQTPYLSLLLDPPPFPIPGPEFFLFWDEVHPTTAGHEVLAEEALFVIENALTP